MPFIIVLLLLVIFYLTFGKKLYQSFVEHQKQKKQKAQLETVIRGLMEAEQAIQKLVQEANGDR